MEIQKRSFEYLMVIEFNDKEVFDNVFQEIDTFDISLQENNRLLSKMILLLTQKNTKENNGAQ